MLLAIIQNTIIGLIITKSVYTDRTDERTCLPMCILGVLLCNAR